MTWFYLPSSSPRMLLLVLVQSRGALHVAFHLRNFAQLMSKPPVPFQQRLASSRPISMNLATKSSLISLLFILLDDVWMVLVAMVLNAVFMVVPFTLMLPPILFTWNAKQVWEQARQLWVKQDLNKCVGTWPELLSRTSTVTMVFMMRVCFVMTASPRTNPKPFPVSVKNIRMQLLSVTFKLYVIGHDT